MIVLSDIMYEEKIGLEKLEKLQIIENSPSFNHTSFYESILCMLIK
mgnify:CR=1 FL=1